MSIPGKVRLQRAPAPSLRSHSMPPRITQESCRPRISDRTMVGTDHQFCLPVFKSRRPRSVDDRCAMKRSQGAIHFGFIRREPKTVETKMPARRAGCRESTCGFLQRRELSLDSPFYRTFPPLRRRRGLDLEFEKRTLHVLTTHSWRAHEKGAPFNVPALLHKCWCRGCGRP